MKLNLKKTVTVDLKDGNTRGFSSGEQEIPNELYEANQALFDRATVTKPALPVTATAASKKDGA